MSLQGTVVYRTACVSSYIFSFISVSNKISSIQSVLIDGMKLDSFGDVILLHYASGFPRHELPQRTETNTKFPQGRGVT